MGHLSWPRLRQTGGFSRIITDFTDMTDKNLHCHSEVSYQEIPLKNPSEPDLVSRSLMFLSRRLHLRGTIRDTIHDTIEIIINRDIVILSDLASARLYRRVAG